MIKTLLVVGMDNKPFYAMMCLIVIIGLLSMFYIVFCNIPFSPFFALFCYEKEEKSDENMQKWIPKNVTPKCWLSTKCKCV